MGSQEGICRFCLKTCDRFKAIEEDMKDALDILLPKMDLAVVQKPVMCLNCANMLIKCYDFKAACFCTRDYIIPLVNNEDAVKLNLTDVYRKKNENKTSFPEDHEICGFCMNPVKKCSAISVDVEKGDVILKNMIGKCLPELDLSIIEKPVICSPCRGSLENCFHFITNCLLVEEKIKTYRESLDVNSQNLMELSELLQFTMRDTKTSKVDGSSVAIKSEKPFCKEIENAGKREVEKQDGVFKLEQMFCEDDEYVKEEAEHISNMDLDDLKFNSGEQFMPEDVLACKEESSHFDVIKIEERFCEEQEPKGENAETEDQKFIFNEEIEIKMEEPDFDRFKDDIVLPQSKVTTWLGKRREQKDPLEVTMYKCASCSYQTRHKSHLKVHLLVHMNPSAVTMYKCDSCPFQSKYRYSFKKHLLVHKSPSEVTMYKCGSCSFQTKYKSGLNAHLLVHRSPSEVTMYKCESCLYQSKEKGNVTKHSLVHKLTSEIKMYKCDLCSYQAKQKSALKTHLLVHKDPSEVTMHKCDYCSYQAKLKCDLKKHILVHKDPSEVTMYKCASCLFQTKHKRYLKSHLLAHKNPSAVTMYKCDLCLFQSKKKGNLTKHLLLHESPLEVTMYKCESCSFQSKEKHNLTRHLLVHVTMYKCESCLFQTKHKGTLTRHLLVHKRPSEVTMYKCDLCSYQAKLKSNLTRHLLVHNRTVLEHCA